MSHPLPGPADYMMVLQNLSKSLVPPDLQQSEPVLNTRHVPLTFAGGFVVTSKIKVRSAGGDRTLALRLFTQLPDGMEARYKAISAFVQQHNATGLFTDVAYIEQGVRVMGSTYPICTMEWLEGDTLRSYLVKNLNNKAAIGGLPDKFKEMITRLRRTGGAHGDLSHDNIMVVNGDLILIDYDGMYVPALSSAVPIIAGQVNFQHPKRFTTPGYFGPYQDNFASICIYVSLLALTYQPTLFTSYADDKNILFNGKDFSAPNQSRLFSDLEKIPALKDLATRFKAVCLADVLETPTLAEFLAGKTTSAIPTVTGVAAPSATGSLGVFTADGSQLVRATTPDRARLLSTLGQFVTFAGRVDQATLRADDVMLTFNSGGQIASAVFIEDDGFQELRKAGAGAVTERYANKWLKVIGYVQMNQYNGQSLPAIVTDSLNDIVIKSSEEINALFNAAGIAPSGSQPPTEKNDWWRKAAHDRKTSQPGSPSSPAPNQQPPAAPRPPGAAFGSLDDL